MRLPRRMPLCALLVAIGASLTGAGGAAATVQSLAERIELLDWSDPSRAVRLIDAAATPAERRLLDVPMLEVSGMVYTDMRRDADAAATLADLEAGGGRGNPSATAAAHFVRGYALHRHGEYAAAATELNAVDVDALSAAVEQYRVLELRGSSLRRLRFTAAALPALQRGLEIAQSLHDDLRSAHAMIELAAACADGKDFDRAGELLAAAQTLAATLGDETLLAAVDGALADIEARHGQPAVARRLDLSALEHARRSDSDQSLARALVDLGGSYLRTREWRESLKYLQLAAPVVARTSDSSVESALFLNQGLALIALGSVKPGQEKAERAISDAVERHNLRDGREMLRAYADALQRAGYLMMALQAYQRFGAVDDGQPSSAQAIAAEPTAITGARVQPNGAVSPMHEAEAAAAAAVQEHPGRQPVVAIFLGLAGVGAAVIWALSKSKQADARLRRSAERDALTGAWTRRHFNDTVLPLEGNRALTGCVLMVDLDHFKRINHTLGHRAGDVLLAAVGGRLAGALRDRDRLVRWEGDAFLILLDAATLEESNQTAERLLLSVRSNPVPWDGTAIECTLSVGYACFPLAGATSDIPLTGAINLVDRALQEAKRRGRDRACLISALNAPAKRTMQAGAGDSEAASAERGIELKEMGVAA